MRSNTTAGPWEKINDTVEGAIARAEAEAREARDRLAELARRTEHIPLSDFRRRTRIALGLIGHPQHGVWLEYSKMGQKPFGARSSKGDMSRLFEWVRDSYDDISSVGLFIPLRAAWPAVKEFIETDGMLPKSIEWVRNKDLPDDVFLDPYVSLPGEPPSRF
jgi:hypothetical protein